jgi:hypothetical protein
VDLGPIGFCKSQIEPQDGFNRLEIGGRACNPSGSLLFVQLGDPPPQPSGQHEFTFLGVAAGIGLVLLAVLLI